MNKVTSENGNDVTSKQQNGLTPEPCNVRFTTAHELESVKRCNLQTMEHPVPEYITTVKPLNGMTSNL